MSKMVITFDIVTGNLDSVTDESGNPANIKTGTLQGDEFGEIIKTVPATFLKTKKNPDCAWVYINGTWYWICDR